MSSRTCPDWPRLIKVDPQLQSQHYAPGQAHAATDALVNLDSTTLDTKAHNCDLQRHVFNAGHPDAFVADALSTCHWFELREAEARRPISAT
jgi:hypothetical protein